MGELNSSKQAENLKDNQGSKYDSSCKASTEKSSKQSKKKKDTGRFTPAQYDWDSLSQKEKKNIDKYGNPRKLGFLRVVMIIFGMQPVMLLLLTQLVTKNDIEMDIVFIHWIFDAVLYTIIFAMIWLRKKATRAVAIAVLSTDILLTILDCFVKKDFQISVDMSSDILQGIILNCLLILYFVFSRRVKYACTRPIHTNDQVVEVKKSNFFNLKSWPFWRDLIIMFIVFGIVGHWMEYGYCTMIKLGWIPGKVDLNNEVWKNLISPFPIYGGGAVACALIFYPLKVKLQNAINSKVIVFILIFVISGVVCSVMELILGFAINQDLAKWDYTNMFCNFMGQVCLQNSVGFAIAATVVTYFVYPLVKLLFSKIERYMNFVFIGVLVLGVLLYSFYYFDYVPNKLKEINTEASNIQT